MRRTRGGGCRRSRRHFTASGMGQRRKCFRFTHFSHFSPSKGKHTPSSGSSGGETAAAAPNAQCVRLVFPLPKAPVLFPIDLEIEKTLYFSHDLKNRRSWKSRKSSMRIFLMRICYREKINVNKLRAVAAESECVTDPELDLLQKEFEEKERIEQMLRGELRVTVNEIDDLEGQQVSFEDQRKTIKKLEQDDLRAQMQLSMMLLSQI